MKRAKINIEKSRYKEALKDLNFAHSLDTTKGETHFLLGNVLLELIKRGDGSEESLKRAQNIFIPLSNMDIIYHYHIKMQVRYLCIEES